MPAVAAPYGKQVTPEYSPAKSKTRIWLGALLIIAGGAMAYDGFSKVRENVSDASFVISGNNVFSSGRVGFGSYWVGNPSESLYELFSQGTIKNTGNVNITNLRMEISYKLAEGASQNPAGYTSPSDAVIDRTGINITETANWQNENTYPSTGTTMPNGQEGLQSANPPAPDINDNVRTDQYAGQTGSVYTDNTANGLMQIRVTGDYQKKYRDKTKNPFEGYAGIALAITGGYLIVDYLISLKKVNYYMQKNDMRLNFAQNSDQVSLLLSKKI